MALLKNQTQTIVIMKKKNIIILISALITAFVLYAALITNVYKKEVRLPETLSLISQQLANNKNISRWYLPFSGADTTDIKLSGKDRIEYNNSSLVISRISGLSAWYQVTEDNKTQKVVFDISADTGIISIVTLRYEATLIQQFLNTSSIIANAKKSLDHLKEYFSDTKKMYGYQIEVTTVTDSAFLFTSKVVARSAKKEAFKKAYESLIKFADENNLGYNNTRIYYMSDYGNDSIHLFTSIGITNTASTAFNDVFSLKKMPYGGRLLTAFYQGSFGNSTRILTAMEQFKTDNEMTSMAIPFIKLINDGIEFDDAQVIQAKAYYPVF